MSQVRKDIRPNENVVNLLGEITHLANYEGWSREALNSVYKAVYDAHLQARGVVS